MTRMAPLLRWRKRGNVSAPSPPTFYYRRDTLLILYRGLLGVALSDLRTKHLNLFEKLVEFDRENLSVARLRR